MATAVPLSCCIITRDEADRIERCVLAVRELAWEVVVVDSGSTDDTVARVEALGARVFHRDWTGYGAQKRFSEECAAHDWILNLDADEVATPELVREIEALMRSEPTLPAYRMKLVAVDPGLDRPRLWADYHDYVRLYDRRQVRFRDSPVHDTVDTGDRTVGRLAGVAHHFSSRSLAHIREKLERYTDLQAKALRKPAWAIWSRLPFEYALVFVRYYLLRRNFTGGGVGLAISHLAAWMRTKRLLKILAEQRRLKAGS